MLTKIKHLLAPPVFGNDDEKNHTARILNVILLSFAALLFIYETIQAIRLPFNVYFISIYYGLCLSMIGLLYLMRRGYVRAASLILTSASWVTMNFMGWWLGTGLEGTAYLSNFIIIILANLLVGWQASMAFALLSILIGWGFVYTAIYGFIRSTGQLPPAEKMIDLTLVVGLVTVLTTLTSTNLRKALKRAHNNERELTISNRELQAIRTSLEDRVVERTQRLQTVADMSGQLNAILDMERLLAELVRQVKEKFDYYHVHIYLLEQPVPGGEVILRLISGYGEAGAKMKAAGHFIPLEATTSLVARAGREREIVYVDNVHQNPEWLRNPLLPDTQAEMAVPIIAEDRVIGVLDVQSDQVAGLDDSDADLLRSLANQVAIAITNARLFAKAGAASKAKSEFLSSMSHELRTPLNGILGYAQILSRGKGLTVLQRDGLNIIQQSGEHLLTLINDILDLSKIEAGRLDLYPIHFNLANCLNGVAGIIRIRAQQKGIAFDLEEITPLPAALYADEKRLRQVLLNLLNNAVKFTNHGNVFLRAATIDGNNGPVGDKGSNVTLHFEVQDTGVGIAPEDMDKIFQPFEQVGENRRKAEGTGLGLSITRRLLEVMGSRLQVNSQPGKGSTFWFEVTLPLGQIEACSPEVVDQTQMIGYKGKERKVLVVDDKQHNRAVMASILEPLGFIIIEADNGQEGVRLAQEQQPDLILMDMMMPIMTGFEATQIIRQIPELKDVIIFGVSASVFEENREQVMIAGCDTFVIKPVRIDNLLALIENYLKLEWVYEEKDESTRSGMRDEGVAIRSDEFDLPPVAELQEIYALAYNGKTKPIRERAMLWKRQNPAFAPFADKIINLAHNFQDEKIMALLKPYLDPEGK